MVMRWLTAEQVHAQKVTELGLDPTSLNLATQEGIAGALRRSAGYLCPCSPSSLVRAVVRPLRGLVPNLDEVTEMTEATLEAMIAHGDILEQSEVSSDAMSNRVLLYTAPMSFIARQSGLVILLGVAPDHLSPLPMEIERRIQYQGYIRKLSPSPQEDLQSELRHLGLLELTFETWLKCPVHTSADQAIAAVDCTLDSVGPSREIPGLLLLDSARPVRYYRGRWTEPKSLTGRYVARRRQAYGADLWSYAQVVSGQPERIIDLPRRGSRWRGCDEAWHLQMAIDAQRGSPQNFRVSSSIGDTAVFEFFSPVPAWARRRWDAIGEPASSKGCLFAYRIAKTEIDEERQFARKALWLEEIPERPR